MNAFKQATSGIPIVPTSMKKLNLQNDIGHESRIELLVPDEVSTFISINTLFLKKMIFTTASFIIE